MTTISQKVIHYQTLKIAGDDVDAFITRTMPLDPSEVTAVKRMDDYNDVCLTLMMQRSMTFDTRSDSVTVDVTSDSNPEPHPNYILINVVKLDCQ